MPSKRGYQPQDEFNLASWAVAVAMSRERPLYFGHYGSEDSRDIDLLIAFRDRIPKEMGDAQFWGGSWARGRVDPTVVSISEGKVIEILREETEFSIPIEDIQNCIHQTVDASLVDYVPPERRDLEAKRRQLLAYARLPGEETVYERQQYNKRLAFVFAQYAALLKGEDAGYTKASVVKWARHKGVELLSIIYPSGEPTSLGSLKAIALKVAETGQLPRWGMIVGKVCWRQPLGYVPGGPGYGQHDPSLDARCAVCGVPVHENPYPLSKHDAWTRTEVLCDEHSRLVEEDYEFQLALLEVEGGSSSETEHSISLHREGDHLRVEVNWGFTSSCSPDYGQSRKIVIPLKAEDD